MKKYIKVMLTLLFMFYVDGLLASDSENKVWTREDNETFSNFSITTNGNNFFKRMLESNLPTGVAKFFDQDTFVAQAKDDKGAKFLICILNMANEDDKLSFASFAEHLASINDSAPRKVLTAMVTNHPITHEKLRKPISDNLKNQLKSLMGRELIVAFAKADEEFALLVAAMTTDELKAFLNDNSSSEIRKALEEIIISRKSAAIKFGQKFKEDENDTLLKLYEAKKLFVTILSIDNTVAEAITGLQKSTIDNLLENDYSKDLVKQALHIQLSKGDLKANFKRPLMLCEMASNATGLQVIVHTLEKPDTLVALKQFANDYFATLPKNKYGVTFLSKLAEKDESCKGEFAKNPNIDLNEICKTLEGRRLIISLAKGNNLLNLAKIANVKHILAQRDIYDNGVDVLKAISSSHQEALDYFRAEYNNCYSAEYKAVKALRDGDEFLSHLQKDL